jgi:tRNA pseudouridine38-40 synthase
MRSFRLTLAYDGTAYAGWQVQANARTIQAELESALQRITGQRVRATASGRTDAGVHALAQVVSLACDTHLPADVLRKALNANLPQDIVVVDACEAPPGFHAIRDAIRKRYRYVIQDGPVRDVFSRAYAWYVPQRLDQRAMSEAAGVLLGEHDFSSFQASGSERASSVRTILDLSVQRGTGDFLDRIVIEVEANGFLYNMVRNIVGSLVQVGRGKRPPTWIADVLQACDRTVAGATAPPEGLFLVHVQYGWSCASPT